MLRTIIVVLGAVFLLGAPSYALKRAGAPTGSGACWTPGHDGWTVICSTAITSGSCSGSTGTANGTCFVAVSSSSGHRTCTSWSTQAAAQAAPCDTLVHGIAQTRTGQSDDWLMLKTGDTWVGQDLVTLCARHGFSADRPFVVTSYGDGARPVVEYSARGGIFFFGGGGCGAGGDYVAIIGIKFYNYTADPGNASFVGANRLASITNLNNVEGMLIEDVEASFGGFNLQACGGCGTATRNGTATIRRSIIHDSYGADSAQGLYAQQVDVTLLQNVFNHNGWHPFVAGAGPTILSHNVYLQCVSSEGCVNPTSIVGNFVANSSSGEQFRDGGTLQGNAFILQPYAHNWCNNVNNSTGTTINWNVYMFQMDLQANGKTVRSTDYVNSANASSPNRCNNSSTTISNNLFVHSITPNTNGGAIAIGADQNGTVASNNIVCDWKGDRSHPLIWDQDRSTLTGNYQLAAGCNQNSYPDPNRTPGSYYATLAGSRPKATFVGSISAGVLTITDISGSVAVGDAITWSGQTKANFIRSFGTGVGGNGTYNLAGNVSIESTSMSSFTANQLVDAMQGNSKNAPWQSSLTACSFNTYIMEGFGITDDCAP